MGRATNRTNSRRTPEATRDRLRDAASALFLSRGYRATSIGAIEKAAGLAPRTGGFYRHYPSKQALLSDIARDIIEDPAEMGFGDLLPLGDTRAELLLIARGYRKAAARQAPLAALIAEVRELPEVVALVGRTEETLRGYFGAWIATKPAAASLGTAGRLALVLMILGGWTLFLGKREAPWVREELDDEAMLERWATHWARVLDAATPPF
jgi:AcrR family transcriptional regulator